MIKGTKAKRETCDHAMERLANNGFQYLCSIRVLNEDLYVLESDLIAGFYAKVYEDLYYIFYPDREEPKSISICDVFKKEEAQS